MSTRGKNSVLTKVRRISTSASLQSEKRCSTSNLEDQADAKIYNILKLYAATNKGIPDIKIFTQSDPFSVCPPRSKPDADGSAEISDVKYVTKEFNKPSVYCYGRNECEGPVRVLFKNKVYEHVVPVLNLATQNFKNIVILELTNCGLKDSHLSLLKNILDDNINIKFLSLEGNPLIEQAYNDILKTQLTHLSLRSCQITLDGIKNIAEELKACDLISLNLSSNYIDDDCMHCLSDPLRMNRKLSSINLADNWFTDIGLISFTSIFKKFQLVHNEIVLRRRANLEYLLEEQRMVKEVINSGLQSKQSIVSIKSSRTPSKRNPCKSIEAHNIVSPKARTLIIMKERITMKIKKDANPLIVDCFPENKLIYCRGNFVVSNLDLSCNNITSLSLKELLNVLKYQLEFCNDNHNCWQKLLFDDNLNRKYPLETLEIFELLQANDKSRKTKNIDRIRATTPSGILRSNTRL